MSTEHAAGSVTCSEIHPGLAHFEWAFMGDEERQRLSEGAAPRAEGLDEAIALLRRWDHWAEEGGRFDGLARDTHATLARLSRPSDEREPGGLR